MENTSVYSRDKCFVDPLRQVTLWPERVWGTIRRALPRDQRTQVVVHKADQPDLFRDLLDADILSAKT